jgi:hypothetical protein
MPSSMAVDGSGTAVQEVTLKLMKTWVFVP